MNTWLSSSNARKHKGNCKGISSYYQKRTNWRETTEYEREAKASEK